MRKIIDTIILGTLIILAGLGLLYQMYRNIEGSYYKNEYQNCITK